MHTRPLRDFALAITLLTALPLRVAVPPDFERRDIAGWFPAVGLLFGFVLGGSAVLAQRYLYGMSATAAVLVLFALAAATRFLHWDGLADVADGWFVEPARRLEAMTDSRIGAFGATVVVFVVLAQVSSLVDLAGSPQGAALVVMAPPFGRTAAMFAAWLGKPIRPGGLGSSVMGSPSFVGLVVASTSLFLTAALAFVWGASIVTVVAVGALSLLLSAATPHVIASRFGGVTGDVMGASVLTTETAVFVLAAVVLGVLRQAGLTP